MPFHGFCNVSGIRYFGNLKADNKRKAIDQIESQVVHLIPWNENDVEVRVKKVDEGTWNGSVCVNAKWELGTIDTGTYDDAVDSFKNEVANVHIPYWLHVNEIVVEDSNDPPDEQNDDDDEREDHT